MTDSPLGGRICEACDDDTDGWGCDAGSGAGRGDGGVGGGGCGGGSSGDDPEATETIRQLHSDLSLLDDEIAGTKGGLRGGVCG